MASSSAAAVLVCLLLSSAAIAVLAFDVKEILAPEPDFSSFTKYLTDSKVADDINGRKTATVLALDNSAVAPLAGLSAAQLKDVLTVHVLLDYYDPDTLHRLFKNKSAVIATLFQNSGHGADDNGLLNYVEKADESMYFGSAAADASPDSELIKVIGARPYDLSVIQVSKAIIPPAVAGGSDASTSAGGNATSLAPKAGVDTATSASSDAAAAPGPAGEKKASSAERVVVVSTALGLDMAMAMAVFGAL
ncbi:fasciclin-like arabinogalactan protein 3 [Zingiber officinale]|uniref:fasciclin-like arabinogalactan protein 3 n=1 Tax=Zingiber officinale TaxID=94328 RepID=UPI001C4C3FCB|nr:fasciclin-like arabinogalactan protein 3 [Zingiber officinale]